MIRDTIDTLAFAAASAIVIYAILSVGGGM